MTESQRSRLELELEFVNKAIEEFKLDEKPDFTKLKEYIRERENIEFRL